MEKVQLKNDLFKINRSPFLTEDEVVQWLGRSRDFARRHILSGLETINLEGKAVFFSDDIADAVYASMSNNRKFKGKVGAVTKGALISDLKETFGCSFVTINDVSQWMGRSRDYVIDHVLIQTPAYGDTRNKLYFVGDVASRLMEMRRSW